MSWKGTVRRARSAGPCRILRDPTAEAAGAHRFAPRGRTFALGAASKSASFYGSSFQGSSFQGSSFQGSSFQGSSFQGSSFSVRRVPGTRSRGLRCRRHAAVRWEGRWGSRRCTGPAAVSGQPVTHAG
ncbi:pentapeptide repeat-containing protein [Streptomyces sp. NPDC020362]|uniref:pentapeptide repeat-containing protein n=1 Tax=unclassified Streptomyces TaxID=2593676 RepID=UPI0033DCA88B